MKTLTPAELKYSVEATGSKFFTRENMKFAGDTMGNYGVRAAIMYNSNGGTVPCWELYRKKPVKHGLKVSAYFNRDTYRQEHNVKETAYHCNSCEFGTHDAEKLKPVKDPHLRYEPGDTIADGECPVCGALCHQVQP